jgi:hypothetical protein
MGAIAIGGNGPLDESAMHDSRAASVAAETHVPGLGVSIVFEASLKTTKQHWLWRDIFLVTPAKSLPIFR